MQELRAQIQAQLKLADTLKKLGDQAGNWICYKRNRKKNDTFSDKNGLPLDLDMGGDLAELKKNLAKFKKGKHGKGLDDIDIEELDFVSKHFFLCCNSCFGVLTTLVSHFSIASSLHSYLDQNILRL